MEGGGDSGSSGSNSNNYTIGVNVTGLGSGKTLVASNSGSSLTINNNGTFNFSGTVTSGQTYNVTISTQPSGQSCYVTNGNGTVGSGNVTTVNISCSNIQTLSCGAKYGTGTNSLVLYAPSGGYSYQISTTAANTLASVSASWGASNGSFYSYTGSLRASLWAVPYSFSGGTITGTKIATFTPSFTGTGAYSSTQLKSNSYSTTNVSGSTIAANPSAGNYCAVLTLEMYAPEQNCSSSGYCWMDYVQFENAMTFY